jgi:hypothetical protein
MKRAYEVEVHFIGEPEFYYFNTRKEAEKCADFMNNTLPESAYFGKVKTTATIHEIILNDNQEIEGGEIVTTYRKIYA